MARYHLPTFLSILHVAIRISLANKAPITDCDEVYNYWEPLHFLMHGYGMQTWEYAPTFALRTYAYILPMSFISRAYEAILSMCPIWILAILSHAFSPTSVAASTATVMAGKPLQFHLLRATIAFLTSVTELRLVNALPSNLAISTWVILLSSTGMFHTSPAFLPSTTVMLCFMHSIVEQLNNIGNGNGNGKNISNGKGVSNMHRAIGWGLISCLMTGWPFCAILFIPLGFHAVYLAIEEAGNVHQHQYTSTCTSNKIVSVAKLLMRVVAYSIIIQAIVTAVDYWYYGTIISPTWNIFVYNTGLGFGGDGINRDELYGVEDISYYLKNLILNWNYCAILGVLALPVLVLKSLVSIKYNNNNNSNNRLQECNLGTFGVILLPAYLWMAVVFSRPHKEERFLFPIYPLFAIGTAVVLDVVIDASGICKLAQKYIRKNEDADASLMKKYIMLGALVPFILLSISRSVLLSDGYTAPLKLYTELYHAVEVGTQFKPTQTTSVHHDPILVCTGGEWYRYPSSYHLPNNARLAFLKSSFDGQLPQQFTQFGSREESLGHQGLFNDLNEEEFDRYVDISDCSYAIELIRDENDSVHTNIKSEVLQSMEADDNEWDMIASFDFLDVDKTPALHRILFLPLIRNAYYSKYALFQKKDS